MKGNLTAFLSNKTILSLTFYGFYISGCIKCIYSAAGTILLIPVVSGLKLKFNMLIIECYVSI